MTGADNAVEVVLRANTANLVAGMKEAASATASSGAAMREEIANLGSSSRTSAGGMSVLTDSLKEWRTHVRTEARYTNFMAAQISGLGVASKGAAKEITGLVSAFAFGGGIGVGIELIKMTAHAFHDLEEAETAAKEEMKKFGDELVAGTDKVKKWSEATLLAMRGASQAEMQAHQDIKPLLDDREKKEKEIALLESNVAVARETEATNEFEAMAKIAPEDEKKLARLREELKLLNETIVARQKAIGAVATEQIGQDVSQEQENEATAAAKKEKLRKDHLARVHAAEGAAQVALDKMVSEHVAQRVQIDENGRKIDDDNQAKHQKEFQERFAALKKELKEAGAEGLKFGTVFGTAFAGIVDGTMSVTKAFANMAKETVRLIFDAVRKKIEAYALEAAAAAAAANAGIPGIGVFVAMAAAAAMEAAVMGLLDSLPSAAGGWSVPHDTIAMVHAGEHILPAPIAQKYEQGAPGGGGGGGDVHLHFPNALAVDGSTMRRLIRDPHFRRELHDAVRTGIL